ncbi:hypothetical protein MTCD1_02054 [Colwellia marinimaniae]|uniref:Uncharacterized protein n=1 Tax=Colwellia marinimaniae TaxID=1513592 RepID=A0ABQ0MVP4_9GAMM|nr:hypothetical protein MTCD1_02054 [Colwellia marinimaniae]
MVTDDGNNKVISSDKVANKQLYTYTEKLRVAH